MGLFDLSPRGKQPAAVHGAAADTGADHALRHKVEADMEDLKDRMDVFAAKMQDEVRILNPAGCLFLSTPSDLRRDTVVASLEGGEARGAGRGLCGPVRRAGSAADADEAQGRRKHRLARLARRYSTEPRYAPRHVARSLPAPPLPPAAVSVSLTGARQPLSPRDAEQARRKSKRATARPGAERARPRTGGSRGRRFLWRVRQEGGCALCRP
jgi:hypothetical protein